MFERKQWEVKQADNKIQYRVRITDTDIGETSPRLALFRLLRELADHPTSIDCGPATAQSLKFSFTGEHWVIDAEASVKGPDHG